MVSGSVPELTNSSTIAGTRSKAVTAIGAGGSARRNAEPVLTGAQARIAEHHRAAVGSAADEATEPLAEADDRDREDVLTEGVREVVLSARGPGDR